MRKLRNKLLLSILTVALTFIALGTTTFAWFSLGGSATINAFEAQVEVPEGIEISLDGENWGFNVSLEELSKNLLFSDVTSADGKTFLISKNKNDDGNATANTHYFQATIYVRTSADYTDINLKNVTFTPETNAIAWKSDAKFASFETGQTYTFDAVNALRVSFVTTNETADDTVEVIELQGQDNHGTVDTTADGIVSQYLKAKSKEIEDHLKITPVAATIYKDAEDSEGTATADELVKIISDASFSDTLTIGQKQLEDENYKFAVLKINVWLEGWDGDCINAILNGKVQLGFEFEASFTDPNA